MIADSIAAIRGFPPLILAAQRLATAMVGGSHRWRNAGQGDTFWQFRPAQPGESRSSIDWRQSARTDEYLVRETERSLPQRVWIWCDGSASMGWRSRPDLPDKRQRAWLLCLAVAELARRGGEIVRAGHPPRPMPTLWHLAAALQHPIPIPVGGTFRHGGAVCLVSDFLMPIDLWAEHIQHLAGHGLRGHLVHLLDPAEQIFPYSGRVRFEGCEDEAAVLIRDAKACQSQYQSQFAEHCQHIADLARRVGWSYTLHRTDQQPQMALLSVHSHMMHRGRQ